MRPGWPFVLPDNHGVVFVRTDDFDFTGGGVGVSAEVQPGDSASRSLLGALDHRRRHEDRHGVGEGDGLQHAGRRGAEHHVPAVRRGGSAPRLLSRRCRRSPRAATSGSSSTRSATTETSACSASCGARRSRSLPMAATRRIRSYPAFYLSGQESGTGNHRAFAALDPCRKDGNACTSGIDCCGGFCYMPEPVGEFDEPVGTLLADEGDVLEARRALLLGCGLLPARGRGTPNTCIAGFCAYIPPLE